MMASGVIEKASFNDMLYAACPRCSTSMNGQFHSNAEMDLRVQCASCGTFSYLNQLQFKYRLKLQLVNGTSVVDAVLFDEVAESLLGVPASKMKNEFLLDYPSLPQVLEELLVGLHVSYSYRRVAPQRNSKHSQFTRDLRVTKIEPLIPQLLPDPAAKLAIHLIYQLRKRQRSGTDNVKTFN